MGPPHLGAEEVERRGEEKGKEGWKEGSGQGSGEASGSQDQLTPLTQIPVCLAPG